MLFDEAVERYLEVKSRRLRGNTMEGYRSAIRCHLMPAWGGREVEGITHEEVQAWVDGFDLPGAAAKAYKTLRQVLRWCVRSLGVRMWLPTEGVELPRRAPRPVRSLAASELNRLLYAMRGEPWEAAALCQAALGLRRSEACGLRWSDLDLRAGTVRIERGAHVVGGEVVEYPTKTARSARTLVLPAFALARLRELRRASGGRGSLCGMAPDAVSRRFRSLARRAGVDATMMGLRHTFATLSVAAGCPVEVVAMMLGHTSVETCYTRYLATSTDVFREHQRRFSRLVLGAAPTSRYSQDSVSQSAADISALAADVGALEGRFVAGTLNKTRVNVDITGDSIWLVLMNDNSNTLVYYVSRYAGVVRKTLLHGTEVTTAGSRWLVMTSTTAPNIFGIYSEARIARYACLRLVQDSVSQKAATGHKHAAGDVTSGTLPIDRGGTGAGTAAGAKTNLGILHGSVDTVTNSNGVVALNHNAGSASATVIVTPRVGKSVIEAVAKIMVPIVFDKNANYCQVRWKRTDTNAWLINNSVAFDWVVIL